MATYGSGPQNRDAIAWAQAHASGKQGTLHLTDKGERAVNGPPTSVQVVGLGPFDRVFLAHNLETGESAIIVTTSQPVRDERPVARKPTRV